MVEIGAMVARGAKKLLGGKINGNPVGQAMMPVTKPIGTALERTPVVEKFQTQIGALLENLQSTPHRYNLVNRLIEGDYGLNAEQLEKISISNSPEKSDLKYFAIRVLSNSKNKAGEKIFTPDRLTRAASAIDSPSKLRLFVKQAKLRDQDGNLLLHVRDMVDMACLTDSMESANAKMGLTTRLLAKGFGSYDTRQCVCAVDNLPEAKLIYRNIKRLMTAVDSAGKAKLDNEEIRNLAIGLMPIV